MMSGFVSKPMMANLSGIADESPIKVFGLAKTKIADIFRDFNKYISDSVTILQDAEKDIADVAQYSKITESYAAKVSGILDILQRNCMKVAFFGRTSNGKSTVVNAMLKNKILPSGIGHTTNCFVQVEGVDSAEAYMVTENAPHERQNIRSVSQLAHALSKAKLDPDSLIRVCWPKDLCHLLREDVIFVDSPGIDVSPDMDGWIEKFCLDADVFVLVVNAESTIMQTEKNFFHKVAARLSKPNIFILNNRWDASATEPETIAEVRQQHIERDVAFLSTELGVASPREAEDRVFFVSALETLDKCLSGPQTPGRTRLAGWEARLIEFSKFEHKFEECISQSALETKFAQHTANGSTIISELSAMWNDIYANTLASRERLQHDCSAMRSRLETTNRQQTALVIEIEDEIKLTVQSVEQKIYSALCDEIHRLSRILEEFDRPFQTDPAELQVYRKELHFHVEECLSRNLHVRCSRFVSDALRSRIQHMNQCVSELLDDVTDEMSSSVDVIGVGGGGDFEMSYHFDCPRLLADFQEDIEFHFTFGITALARRFLSPRSPRHLAQMSRGFSSPSGAGGQSDVDSVVTVLGAFTNIYSGTTVGTLAVVAVITKSIGWKAITACAAVYCLLYVYERVTWTNKAKEEAFKRQYIDYASGQLSMIIGIATGHCSSQVERQLLSAYDLLKHRIELAKTDMQGKLEQLRADGVRLDATVGTADKMRSRAGILASQLSAFVHQFLKPVPSLL